MHGMNVVAPGAHLDPKFLRGCVAQLLIFWLILSLPRKIFPMLAYQVGYWALVLHQRHWPNTINGFERILTKWLAFAPAKSHLS